MKNQNFIKVWKEKNEITAGKKKKKNRLKD